MTHSDTAATHAEESDRPAVALQPADPNLYDEGYYRTYEGGSYERNGHWTRWFGHIAEEIVARWNPKSTLDAGCALGVFVGELRERGVDAWGTDLSEFAIGTADSSIKPFLRVGSLADGLDEGLPKKFDLISCIEVLEHMTVPEGDRAIANLCAATDRILFSSTPDGFDEATHFSCRPPEDWSAVFASHGFFRDVAANASFLAPWAVVYSRQDMTTFEAVLSYDRQLSRLLEENRQLRDRVISLDKQVAEFTADGSEPESVQMQREITQLQDEVGNWRTQSTQLSEELARAATAVQTRAEEIRGEIERSATWRVGSTVLMPARAVRDLVRRGRNS